MLKKVAAYFLMITLMIISSFFVYAQTEPLQDFKTVLIDSIQSYFSESPKLTTAELKDLIVAYFSTNTDSVDLSINGQFSGEKLINIYNKAKGSSNPTGEWTPQVNIARVIDASQIVEGCYAAMDVTIGQGSTNYFLADPKGSGIEWRSASVRFDVVDPGQSHNINIYYPQLIKLNANNDQIWKVNIPGSGDFGRTTPGYTQEEYNQGIKFLIEIVEKGSGSQAGVDIFWQFN